MKSTMQKYTALLLLLLLLLSCLSACTPADEEASPGTAENAKTEYVEIRVSENGEVLYIEDKVYCRYYWLRSLTIDTFKKYYYHNKISLPDEGCQNATVCIPYHGAEYLWVYGEDGYGRIFATEEGTKELTRLAEGDASVRQLIRDDCNRAYIDDEFVNALESARLSGDAQVTVKVTELKDCTSYIIANYEETESLTYYHGAIYIYRGDYYYLNYSILDNSYFDSDGYFSYRQGSVALTKLDDTTVSSVVTALSTTQQFRTEYLHETIETDSDDLSDDLLFDDTTGIVLFWICYVLVGFLCPIPVLVVGLVLPRSKKRGSPRYWYSAAVIAALWILTALCLLLLLVF